MMDDLIVLSKSDLVGWFCEFLDCDIRSTTGDKVRLFVGKKFKEG